MEHKIYDNEEIRNMFTALGVSKGTAEDALELNIEKLRYHKVVIMTDADIDGSHITTLILTFFFRHMKELIEQGYIYIASPPLYLVKKGKEEEYCWNDEQRMQAVRRIAGPEGKGGEQHHGNHDEDPTHSVPIVACGTSPTPEVSDEATRRP